MKQNTLRYVQVSQERHTIQGANVPGTAVQLHRSLISKFSLKIAANFAEQAPSGASPLRSEAPRRGA